MKKSFDDYFYDNYLEISRTEGKPYIFVRSEMEEESTQVHLHKDEIADLIKFLQLIYKDM